MDLEDQFKLLVLAYYGVCYLDEYDLKVYVLRDIENYIRDFIKTNSTKKYNYREMAEIFEKEASLKTKLQDALLILHQINAPLELVLLVKKRIKMLEDM